MKFSVRQYTYAVSRLRITRLGLGAAGMCVDAARRAMGKHRSLPDFIIVGAQKAGTTSLFGYLSQHPEVRMPARKELHYFDRSYQKGELWYRGHFPRISELKKYAMITGEATPNYLFHPASAGRIRTMLPEAKLIVMLRNPVDRAISHYSHVARYGAEPLPLLQALQQEEMRLAPEIDKLKHNPDFRSNIYQYYSYLSRGRYAEQLERYFSVFPREQILVLKAEDLFASPASTLQQVYAFLGIDPSCLPADIRPRNVGGYDKGAVSKEAYVYLSEYFKPYNERLYAYLGRDFGW